MFITFEGPEGCGKSTQAVALLCHLEGHGYDVVLTREPGGTIVGEALREILLHQKESSENLSPESETLLFCAARAQLVAEVIRPALAAGRLVICDRFGDSTLAYQSFGRGMDKRAVRSVLSFATGGLKPDLTFLLDLPPEVGLARKNAGREDRFEQLSLEFHRRVRVGYTTLAGEEPTRWRVHDATLPPQVLAKQIAREVDATLSRESQDYNQD